MKITDRLRHEKNKIRDRLYDLLRSARPGKSQKQDHGFTLVELLIVITILPIVVGAISVGLLSVFSLHTNVSNRISDSANSQILSAYFIKDVQSADQVNTQTSSSPQCGTGTQLLGLTWNSSQTIISYIISSGTNGTTTTYSLVRQKCTAGNSTPVSSTTLISDIASNQPPPSIACSATAQSCAASTSWISTAGVSGVTFNILELASNYSFSLTATPRLWTSLSGGLPSGGAPYAPFTILDPTSCNALQAGQGTISINVGSGTGNGILGIESTCPGTVSVSNGGTISASSVITGDTLLNSIAPNSKATYPGTEYYNNKFANPFSSLTPPTKPSGSDQTCSSSTSTGTSGTKTITYSCPSGIYASPPSFSTTDTTVIDFTGPGSYWFQQGISVPNNATINFSSGSYIFDGTNPLTTGNNVSANGSNVLLYIESGPVSLGNNTNFSLTPESGYQNVVIWDAVKGGTFSIGNNTDVQSNLTLEGGIYIPYGTLITGSNVSINTTFLETDTANFGNNVNLTVSSP